MKIKIGSRILHLAILIISVFAFSQCTPGSDNKNAGSIKTEFKKGSDLNPKEWKCQSIENNTICIPINWQFIEQNKVFYFASLDTGTKTTDRNTFFTVIKSDINQNKLIANQYLKEGYSQMLKDTAEALTGYTLKKMTFQNQESYYAEYFSTVNLKEYFAYSMIFEKEGYLYDIALKLPKNQSPQYKEIFKNILFNFKINNNSVFSEYDKIEKIEVVDLSK